MILDGLGPARRWLAVSAVGVLGKAPDPTEAGGRWRGYQPRNRKATDETLRQGWNLAAAGARD